MWNTLDRPMGTPPDNSPIVRTLTGLSSVNLKPGDRIACNAYARIWQSNLRKIESLYFGSACDIRRRSKETGPEIGHDRRARAASCDGRRALPTRYPARCREGRAGRPSNRANIKWLRHENAKGAHIYVRFCFLLERNTFPIPQNS
jgi:hypothetical protein